MYTYTHCILRYMHRGIHMGIPEVIQVVENHTSQLASAGPSQYLNQFEHGKHTIHTHTKTL